MSKVKSKILLCARLNILLVDSILCYTPKVHSCDEVYTTPINLINYDQNFFKYTKKPVTLGKKWSIVYNQFW